MQSVHRDLTRIHHWLGNTAAIVGPLRRDPVPVRRVLDIGCGGGGVLLAIRRALATEVIGVDVRVPADHGPVRIVQADAVREPLPPADVAISICMAHHLSEENISQVIRNVRRSCRRFLLLDLVRHPIPLFLFRAAARPFVGRLTWVDGQQSIRRAYTPVEMRRILAHSLQGTAAQFRHTVAPFYVRQMVDIRFDVGNTMWPGVNPRSRQNFRYKVP